jgi:hypothetical protein
MYATFYEFATSRIKIRKLTHLLFELQGIFPGDTTFTIVEFPSIFLNPRFPFLQLSLGGLILSLIISIIVIKGFVAWF